MKFTIEQRVELFKKYYQKQNPRPLFGFFCTSEYPLQRYKSAAKLPEGKELTPEDFDPADYAKDSHELFDIHEQCGGDFIWSASAFWGIPWVEAALGCPIYADHSTGSAYAKKPAYEPKAKNIPAFDPNAPWLKKMDQFLKTLADSSAGKWPIATTRMRGIADLLSTIYGGDTFIMAMLEDPESVTAICEKLTDYWLRFARFQLERIPPYHGGIGSFYYNMWAPPGTVWHQEDAAALLSPDLYDRFIKPCDEKIAAELENCIIHQHPAGFMPIDRLVKMDMTAIELHVDQGGKRARELNKYHIEILENCPLLIWGHLTDDDFQYIFNELPQQGLAIMAAIDQPEQAAPLWDKYMKKFL